MGRATFGDGKAAKGVGLKPRVVDPEQILRLRLDFMPFYKRTVQPKGCVVDYIYYYDDVLRPYISAVERKSRNQSSGIPATLVYCISGIRN